MAMPWSAELSNGLGDVGRGRGWRCGTGRAWAWAAALQGRLPSRTPREGAVYVLLPHQESWRKLQDASCCLGQHAMPCCMHCGLAAGALQARQAPAGPPRPRQRQPPRPAPSRGPSQPRRRPRTSGRARTARSCSSAPPCAPPSKVRVAALCGSGSAHRRAAPICMCGRHAAKGCCQVLHDPPATGAAVFARRASTQRQNTLPPTPCAPHCPRLCLVLGLLLQRRTPACP